jgi:predicted O-methyltransferase YrrM
MVLRGLISPSSRQHCIDPFEIKRLSKFHPYRLVWTAQNRILEGHARASHKPFYSSIEETCTRIERSRGEAISDTAVTENQLALLLKALDKANQIDGCIVEVGSYRGVTTARLAENTQKRVYAVDPYIGYGGSDHELELFLRSTSTLENVIHIRQPSGVAARECNEPISLVFIDAIHDFSNSWHDFSVWFSKISRGGFIAMHDVDDFPGVGRTCRLIAKDPEVIIWGYAPNLVIFQRR